MEFSLYGKPPSSAAITSIRLERREPARNRLRFYNIAANRTLFDGWAVVREWGRIGQAGTVREAWFEPEGAARAAGGQWRQRKERRGYRIVGGQQGQKERNRRRNAT